jgi:hypothetical protein
VPGVTGPDVRLYVDRATDLAELWCTAVKPSTSGCDIGPAIRLI